MRAIVSVGALLGWTLLSACSGESKESGGEAGAAGESGAASGSSGSGGVAGTGGTGGAGGVAGTSSPSGGSAGVGGSISGSGGTASGGIGGTSSNNGGSAGSGGSSSCSCIDEELRWGQNGGFVAYVETSTLEPCHTFTLVRETFGNAPPAAVCTDPIDSCEGTVDPGDIEAALEHPDVVRAFADSPTLFGRDARPVDGQVFQIHLGSALIEIGYECNGAADCVDEPAGVATLRTLLETLTMQMLARQPCSDAV